MAEVSPVVRGLVAPKTCIPLNLVKALLMIVCCFLPQFSGHLNENCYTWFLWSVDLQNIYILPYFLWQKCLYCLISCDKTVYIALFPVTKMFILPYFMSQNCLYCLISCDKTVYIALFPVTKLLILPYFLWQNCLYCLISCDKSGEEGIQHIHW